VYQPDAIARQFGFIRETLGPNRGVWVEAFQRIGDGKPGDSWCADFVSGVLWIAYQGPPPVPRTGSCDVMWAIAKQYETTVPVAGDLFFRIHANGDAHHVGIVTATGPLRGIAGNTSPDGTSSNGTGVFEHPLTLDAETHFARLPLEIS
jgi:hypothetical protein